MASKPREVKGPRAVKAYTSSLRTPSLIRGYQSGRAYRGLEAEDPAGWQGRAGLVRQVRPDVSAETTQKVDRRTNSGPLLLCAFQIFSRVFRSSLVRYACWCEKTTDAKKAAIADAKASIEELTKSVRSLIPCCSLKTLALTFLEYVAQQCSNA